MKRFEINNELFRKIYRRMDSLKADFLNMNYPGGEQINNHFKIY